MLLGGMLMVKIGVSDRRQAPTPRALGSRSVRWIAFITLRARAPSVLDIACQSTQLLWVL
jgi:hypothetical protein